MLYADGSTTFFSASNSQFVWKNHSHKKEIVWTQRPFVIMFHCFGFRCWTHTDGPSEQARYRRKWLLRRKVIILVMTSLEAILSAIDDNILEENEEFTSEINTVSCDLCDKVCKTQRGLTRHRNSKHKTARLCISRPLWRIDYSMKKHCQESESHNNNIRNLLFSFTWIMFVKPKIFSDALKCLIPWMLSQ